MITYIFQVWILKFSDLWLQKYSWIWSVHRKEGEETIGVCFEKSMLMLLQPWFWNIYRWKKWTFWMLNIISQHVLCYNHWFGWIIILLLRYFLLSLFYGASVAFAWAIIDAFYNSNHESWMCSWHAGPLLQDSTLLQLSKSSSKLYWRDSFGPHH